MLNIAYLQCSKCGDRLDFQSYRTVCGNDGGSLFVRYNIESLRSSFIRESLCDRQPTIWRYREVLPGANPVSLGEGFTPLIQMRNLPNVFIKDESRNPTGSFKDRGLSVGITMAQQYGLTKLALPSAGNAASALAAYCAASGIEAHIFMPKDVSLANLVQCRSYGAQVVLVEGSVSDCVAMVEKYKHAEGWFDISSLKEPFRLEGKKTMGYEIAEQFGWKLPDAIIFPTGGGVGVTALWKAFDEMEQLGWIGPNRPKMISVQAAGCAPIVKAWNEGRPFATPWPNASTVAAGLRVPKPYGDYLVLDVLKRSHGTALTVPEEDILTCVRDIAAATGLFPSPEGAASFAGYKTLLHNSFLHPRDRVVLFNTGSGLKYLEPITRTLQD